MTTAIEGLAPRLVWQYFAEFSRIPRCSKHEGAAARYVIETAARLGLESRQDRAGNVVVRKAATGGPTGTSSVCLQGHLDMVCEKRPDSRHDFLKDPIELVRRNGFLMANGTTLGADNGIAVATNLALMEDRTVAHGPLEFLFTVDEETGLTGAHNLQPGFLQSRTLINLDSEEEGVLYVGCAGGRDTIGTWPLAQDVAPKGARPIRVIVSGLRGGHSGVEIDKGRGNAIKILNRAVLRLIEAGARLSALDGGNKRNAIPRDATALLYIGPAHLAAATSAIEDLNTIARAELASVEPDLAVSIEAGRAGRAGKVMKRSLEHQITRTISAMPHGVIKLSADIPGLVETSTNTAVVSCTRGRATLATSQRSSVQSELDEMCESVAHLFELGGAQWEATDGYPGWKPNLTSPILEVSRRTYRSLFGKDPEVKAVHAGLECGIIGERFPGMDMVSFGPTLLDVHSPEERIEIASVPKFWNFLVGVLGNVRT